MVVVVVVLAACDVQRPLADALSVGHILEVANLLGTGVFHVVDIAHVQRLLTLVHVQIGLGDIVPGAHLHAGVVVHAPLGELVVLEGGDPQVVGNPLVGPAGRLVVGDQCFVRGQTLNRVGQRIGLALDDPDGDAFLSDLLQLLFRPGVGQDGLVGAVADPAVVADEHVHQLGEVPHGLRADAGAVGVADQDNLGDVVVLLEPLDSVGYFFASVLVVVGVDVGAAHDHAVQIQPSRSGVVIGHVGAQVVGLEVAVLIEALPVGSAVAGHVQNQRHALFGVVAGGHLVVNRYLTVKRGVVVRIDGIHIGHLIAVIDVVHGLIPHAAFHEVAVAVGQADAVFHIGVGANGENQIQLFTGEVVEGLAASAGVDRITGGVAILVKLLRNGPAGGAEHTEGLVVGGALVKGQGNGSTVYSDLADGVGAFLELAVLERPVPNLVVGRIVSPGHIGAFREGDLHLVEPLAVEVGLRVGLDAHNVLLSHAALSGSLSIQSPNLE